MLSVLRCTRRVSSSSVHGGAAVLGLLPVGVFARGGFLAGDFLARGRFGVFFTFGCVFGRGSSAGSGAETWRTGFGTMVGGCSSGRSSDISSSVGWAITALKSSSVGDSCTSTGDGEGTGESSSWA